MAAGFCVMAAGFYASGHHFPLGPELTKLLICAGDGGLTGTPNMTFEGRFLPRFIPWHMCSFLVVFSCSAQQPGLSEGCERSQCARFPCMASGGVLIQAACLSATCSYQPASYTTTVSTHASYCIQLCV
jgi:hypothetical protein